jgi:TfuA protein
MRKPIIFLGPSMSNEKAKAIFNADYKPPAKKGDLLRLGLSSDISVVGLVDGMFLQDYPPTPIEVYQLVAKKNVMVVGAASLGALRAVELERFGMIGIGKIFDLYRKGKVTADDEVAVTFEEGSYRLQSEAMIDIRFNLFLAEKRGIVDKHARKILTRVAKKFYFPLRNYNEILDYSVENSPEYSNQFELFRSYIASNRISLKELDAIKLIEYVKAKYEQDDK